MRSGSLPQRPSSRCWGERCSLGGREWGGRRRISVWEHNLNPCWHTCRSRNWAVCHHDGLPICHEAGNNNARELWTFDEKSSSLTVLSSECLTFQTTQLRNPNHSFNQPMYSKVELCLQDESSIYKTDWSSGSGRQEGKKWQDLQADGRLHAQGALVSV